MTLRIAVGPVGSADHKLIQAMAAAFDRDRSGVRLSLVSTEGADQSLALLGTSKADLAVARGDLNMPSEAEAVIVVRSNVVVLWSPSGLPAGAAKKQKAPNTNTLMS